MNNWICGLNNSGKIWDLNLTWYTDNPDFTPCFHNSILYWIPCVYLCLCSPFYFAYLCRHDKGYIRMSHLSKAKTSIAVLLACLCYTELFCTVWNITHQFPEPPVLLISLLLLGSSMLLAACIIQYERIQGIQSSCVLLLYWLFSLLCAALQLRSKILHALHEDSSPDVLRSIVFFAYCFLVLVQFLLSIVNDQLPLFADIKSALNPCPEAHSSFLSQITFNWFTGIMMKGYKHPLEEEDIWALRSSDTAEETISEFSRQFQRSWDRTKQIEARTLTAFGQQNREAQNVQDEADQVELLIKSPEKQMSSGVLLKIICRTFGVYYLIGSFLMLLFTILMFMSPLIMWTLLDILKDPSARSWHGYVCATLLFICPCAQSIFCNQHDYICYVTGMRIKSALISSVYRKVLVITNAGRKNSSAGEIVNLISSDVQKLIDVATCLNSIWAAPLTIVIGMVFLWKTLGIAVLAGVGVFVLNIPFMTGFGVKIKKLQGEQMKHKDSRIKSMNEILQGIKVLKLYAWENAFLKKVQDVRQLELKVIKRAALILSAAVAAFLATPFLVTLIMFAVHLAVDQANVLNAQKAFVAILLLNILRLPLRTFPMALNLSAQSFVALQRLSKFFAEDELEPENMEHSCTLGNEIEIQDGTFAWSIADGPCLQSININISRGSLVAVVGQVGSGKTSLLSAMLGEMEKFNGRVAIKGAVAYVPQQAWIPNASFRDNVLFGQKFVEHWYNAVVKACALLPDVKMLPAGENTEIGEKGVNLSGGQKQRISVARALYRKSDVYLMDDPLSAVDANVGQHLFENVIGPNGLLKDKTRVLVTHGVSFLPQMDTIIVMSDGKISEMGSYTELILQNGTFAEFLQTYACGEHNGRSKEERPVNTKEGSSVNKRADSDERTFWNGQGTPLKKDMSHQDKEKEHILGKLTEADKARTGKVKLSVYLEYLKMIGGVHLFLIFLFYMIQQTAAFLSNYWIALWADDPVVNGTQQNRQLRMGVYGFLGSVQVLGIFAATAVVILGGVLVSKKLHFKLLYSILRCPLSFFERTPSGNLTNRFAKEMDTVDNIIPHMLMMTIMMFLNIAEILLIIAVATPLAALAFLPFGLLYFFLQRFFVSTSRQLKRLESVSKSPLYTHINETLQGVGVIRAFKEQGRFIQGNNSRLDTNQRLYYSSFVANRWLSVRSDLLSNFIVFSVAVVGVICRGSISPGLVGLAVMNSLRAPWSSSQSSALQHWPEKGAIVFTGYGLQYRSDLQLALRNITVTISQGEKIGIVGRTGAGKSSLTLGLFRILEPAAGTICIDGIDISKLGLHELRSKLTIIPQDPVLFSGSLRMNLDPFDSYTDEDIWTALDLAHLKNFAMSLPEKLNHTCSEGGENLSVGQRQLVCLARALLRKSKILVLDEATAAVDLETDALIQTTIRAQFEGCTVLTIAHRLNTIMDYTRIIVFEEGQIVECDNPAQLLAQKGVFYGLAKDANII
ncbi:multidrug resistance-associated protein 1-like isoform X2 [Ambystoma mexicanum]|uniref:multidrug resistance-associated protein 1-like isoform X2 n=1 Tax=Ambystoma mexicanum TaxID=8296 RepID=UPI0037E81841